MQVRLAAYASAPSSAGVHGQRSLRVGCAVLFLLLSACRGNGTGEELTPRGADAGSSPGEWRRIAAAPFEQAAISGVWTGREAIVAFDPGFAPHAMRFAAYDPATDRWAEPPAPPIGLQAPFALTPVAVWSGDEVLVWGYADGPGGDSFDGQMRAMAYDPSRHSWRTLPDPPVQGLIRAEPVWTGTELLVWGGNVSGAEVPAQGAGYNPVTDHWRTLPAGPLAARENPTTIWTGREMIIWGGIFGDPTEGAAYNPHTDRWRVLARSPLSRRAGATAAWTDEEMVVWGGYGTDNPADGAAYNPDTDHWRHVPNAPLVSREQPGSAWTGQDLVIWGGISFLSGREARSDGAAYDPRTDRWHRLPRSPLASRFAPAAVWSDRELVLVGGYGPSAPGQRIEPARRDGASYQPPS
jgi:hypothetical protein